MSNTKYTKEILEDAVKQSVSFAGVIRHLGLKEAGGTYSHITRKIKEYEIDTTHFTGAAWNKGKILFNQRLRPEQILILRDKGGRQNPTLLQRGLIESGIKHECQKCRTTS